MCGTYVSVSKEWLQTYIVPPPCWEVSGGLVTIAFRRRSKRVLASLVIEKIALNAARRREYSVNRDYIM